MASRKVWQMIMDNPIKDKHIKYLRNDHDWSKYSYHPAESYINSDRPRIRCMVFRLVELGFKPLPF